MNTSPSAASNTTASNITADTTSRRTFLRNSSLIVAGSAIAAGPVQAQIAKSAHSYGSDTIKIGLISCGGRGSQHEPVRGQSCREGR